MLWLEYVWFQTWGFAKQINKQPWLSVLLLLPLCARRVWLISPCLARVATWDQESRAGRTDLCKLTSSWGSVIHNSGYCQMLQGKRIDIHLEYNAGRSLSWIFRQDSVILNICWHSCGFAIQDTLHVLQIWALCASGWGKTFFFFNQLWLCF